MAKKKDLSSIPVSTDYVLSYFDKIFLNADQDRMAKETIWNHAWNLLNNVFENEQQKEEWQSLVYTPDVPRISENISKKLVRASKRSERFYDIEAPKNTSVLIPLNIDELKRITYVLYNAVFYHLVHKNNYYTKFEDGVKSGLLSRILFKLGWRITEYDEPSFTDEGVEFKTVKKGGLWFDNIDPYRYWNDGTGLNRFRIHEYKISYPELLIAAQNKNNRYDLDAVKKLKDETSSKNDRQAGESNRKQQGGQRIEDENVIYVQEVYCDLPSEDNETLYKGITFSVANETIIIRKPVKVGTWLYNDPFIEAEIIRKPFQTYHSGMIENIAGLAEFRTQILRLIADSSFMSALFALEIDAGSITDPDQFSEGFYPGFHYFVDRKEGQGDAVRPVKLAQTTQDVFSAFGLAGELEEDASQINAFTTSGGDLPSRTPARTFLAKSQEGNAFHNGISETLEDTLIVPLIEKSIALILQYQDWNDPEIRAVCGDDVDLILGLSEEERFNLMKLHFQVKARGMSIELSRQEEIQKIESYFKLIAEITQMEPILLKHGYDFHEVIDDLTDLFGFKNLDFIRKFKERHAQIMKQAEQMPALPPVQPTEMMPNGAAMPMQGAPQGAPMPQQMTPEMMQMMMANQPQ